MNEILSQTNSKMKQTKCLECGSTDIDLEQNTFRQSCADCGAIIEDQIMITATSAKGTSGELERQGQVTNMRSTRINFDRDAPESLNSNNIYKIETKMKIKFQYIVSKLGGDHPQFPIVIENALRIWRLCFEKKLTRGYDGDHLASILFYMACRQMQPSLPFLLLDFAAIVEINVYKLASKFQKLCRDIPIEINSLTDPSIYISRFASMLEFENETENVTATACKLVDQMKQDWITTGRRPSGICGAALLIAARMHGFKRNLKEIADVVNLTEGTIKKRVNEFLETKIATMTVDSFKKYTRDEVNNNASKRKEDELEMPPIIRKQEKQLIKIQKKEEIKIKKKQAIQQYDEKYNEENNINTDTIDMIQDTEKGDSDNDDDDIQSLMKPDPKQHTVFVAAKQTDDDIIDGVQIQESSSQRRQTSQTPQTPQTPQTQSQLSDKREMDASDDDEMDNNEDIDINCDANCIENGNDETRTDRFFDNASIGGPGQMSYITSATRSDLIDDDDEFEDDGTSFIVGANATQLDEYEDFDDCNGKGTQNEGKDDKQDVYKYYEEHDLSHLDNDPEIQSMILSEREIHAKHKLFMICNPDWIKVKKDMDRREMIKEEKERKNKRNLRTSYKDDPMAFVAGKVSKRFRSDRINVDVFHKLMGAEPSPSVNIKKQDPFG